MRTMQHCFIHGTYANRDHSCCAARAPSVTLFKNVRVFDGTTDGLLDLDVLVVGNKIQRVAEDIPESGTWEVNAGPSGPLYSRLFANDTRGYTFIVQDDEGPRTVELNLMSSTAQGAR